MPPYILHIEDNLGDQLLMQRKVQAINRDWVVHTVSTLAEGLAVEDADIVLLDLGLPDSQGLDTLARFRASRPTLPIVVLTGQRQGELALQALREGAEDFLSKDSLTATGLLRAVELALERRRLTVELEQSKQNFAAIVQTTADPIWVIAPNGTTLFANQVALRIQGDGVTAWGHQPLQDSVHQLGGQRFQLRVTDTHWFEETCTLVMAYDVTTVLERQAETNQLRKALDSTSRRQDLGRLATGLAHSINNALVGVLSVAARVDPLSAAALTEATRCIQGITLLMGTFSDDQARAAAPNNLRAVLQASKAELQLRARNHIEFVCVLSHELCGANFSKEYLQPILGALMDNALLAGCTRAWLSARPEGDFAVIVWECQTLGEDSPARERMRWERVKSNPGALALTATQAFALSAGGRTELWLAPRDKNEVKLKLYLPLRTLQTAPHEPDAPVPTKGSLAAPVEQKERLHILVVDDDDLVRRSICRALRHTGHLVYEAIDGLKGLEIARAESLDVIVCDVRMPGMNGPTMVRTIRVEGDKTPVLMISGFSEIELPAGAQISSLSKPFLPKALMKAIAEILQL
ncbi:MAG: CheY-like chemotaxis protein [Cognaticolwellia sp.]|jgi:CheY-like chemotaxis protein